MTYSIDSKTLRCLIKTGKKALHGDSNDAEHDALYMIVAALDNLLRESQAEAKPSGSKPRDL